VESVRCRTIQRAPARVAPFSHEAPKTGENGAMKVGDKHYRSLWSDPAQGVVHIIDQARLPHVFETAAIRSADEMAQAIRSMRVRGAPLIGVAAAHGIALAVSRDSTDASISEASNQLRRTRPTAINLAWAIGRMREKLAPMKLAERAAAAWKEAQAIADEDVRPERSHRPQRPGPARARARGAQAHHQHPHALQCGLDRDRRLGDRHRSDLHGAPGRNPDPCLGG
jgi:hypothetical protein